MGADEDDHRPGLLVMVDVIWTRWAPLTKESAVDQPWLQHGKLLDRWLSPDDGAGHGSLLQVPDVDEWRAARDHASTAQRHLLEPALLAIGFDESSDRVWSTPSTIGRDRARILEGLEHCCSAYIHHEDRMPRRLVEAATNLFAHRIHLRDGQLWRLISDDRNKELRRESTPRLVSGVHACVDFRVRHQLGSFWLYATISLWNSAPRSVEHAPQQSSQPRRADTRDVRTLREAFQSWRDDFKSLLLEHYLTVEPTVLQEGERGTFYRKYRPPRFWVVGCAACVATEDGQGSPDPDDCRMIETLCRETLRVPGPTAWGVTRDTVETRRWIDEGVCVPMRVYRHLKHLESQGAAPAYVVAPLRSVPESQQEDAVQELVYALTAVETAVAARLLDVTTELDIDARFATVYRAVVQRGAELWDQLAMRLPLARGSELDELHQLIELIHLTLLQGLADLGYLKAKVVDAAADLATANDDDLHALTTRLSPCGEPDDSVGLIESLRSGGYMRRTRRWADGVVSTTESALENFTSLLNAISQAFDERRVRETDRIGEIGLFLAVVLGFVGFVTESLGAVIEEVKHEFPPWLFLAGFVLALGFAVLRLWSRGLRPTGTLSTTTYFRAAYGPVCEYLQLCRSERLHNLDERELRRRRAHRRDVVDVHTDLHSYAEYHARWHRLDVELSRRLAHVIDGLGSTPTAGPPRSFADALRVAVEEWTVHALLISERPRKLYSYPLPCLTLMYRFYPFRGESVGLRVDEPPVSDAELLLMLRVQVGAELRDIGTVIEWGEQLRERALEEGVSAVATHQTIVTTGIRTGMTRRSWMRIHDDILAQTGTAPTRIPQPRRGDDSGLTESSGRRESASP